MSDLGNKEIFAKNLKYYMELNNKDRNDICRDLKFPYTTFAEWYNGNIYPRIDKIELIANYFNIKKSDLIERKEKKDPFGNPVTSIPILGIVKAGYDYLAQENWVGTIDVETSLVGNGNDYFALKIIGDSMSPVLIQDDIVVIKKQNDFENGDIVVAIVNGNEATIEKGKKTDSSITLQPLNTAYDPLVFTYDEVKSIPVTIVGIVKQLKRDF